MKKLLLVIFLLPLMAKSQTIPVLLPEKDGRVLYEEVVEINKSQQQLYQNAKYFMVTTFRDANKVIQNDDKEIGQIIGKGNTSHSISYMNQHFFYTDRFTIQVDCKENKYRYKIFDITMDGSGASSGAEGSVDDFNAYLKGEKSMEFPKLFRKKLESAFITNTQQHVISIDNNIKSLIASLKTAMNKTGSSEDF